MTAARCPLCGALETAVWRKSRLGRPLEPEDLRITDRRYGLTLPLLRCEGCRFVFAEPAACARLDELYARLEDTAYEEGAEARRLQFRRLLGRLLRVRPEARTLLDVGAGTGLLVDEARGMGLQAEGVEPSRSAVARAAECGRTVWEGGLPHPELRGRRFDLITLVDVVEHVADPPGLVSKARELLAPDGVLLVVTPDLGTLTARLLGRRWWHFRLAHVGYFRRETLERLADAAGLAVRDRFRPSWVLPLGYLMERLEHYLPIGWFNRWARRRRWLRGICRASIRFNLFDSTALVLEAKRA